MSLSVLQKALNAIVKEKSLTSLLINNLVSIGDMPCVNGINMRNLTKINRAGPE